MPRILIVADSTCDVPPEWVRRFDVRLVPTYVHFGMESLADDGIQLTRQGFYERLAADPIHPTTAAPPPGGVMEVLARALDEADHVIALTAPKELSGIFNTFRLAAEELGPERVTLIDGRSTSMGLGWQVTLKRHCWIFSLEFMCGRRSIRYTICGAAGVWVGLPRWSVGCSRSSR